MKTIPEYGRPYDEILEELKNYGIDDPAYKDKKTWSLVYYKDEEYTHFLAEAFEKYMSANGLNPTAFKSLKRFENDIVAFTAELLHADEKAAGCVTSCGTESCKERPGLCPVKKLLELCLICWDTQLAHKMGSKVTLEP